ncbi:hypothetical protein [Cellulomonas sp. SLBN-39]|uniref:hypothetical protein n=1 Tax=Cellulomonas sp. SLBN-39 TaxID=2768446 RepID=UPI001150F084|nr:hypothetical protein [Cellulomonas sp. SLBN-39]TQL02348.1 hypothetical protein FBY24_1422 [Cellulomonas sp. SLBN-39]
MSPWAQGITTVDTLVGQGQLERVPVNADAAASMIAQARRHLVSAETLAPSDVVLAYDALHAANRKALTAVLLAQGLRPTRAGGHTAVHEAARAQLDPPLGKVVAPYSRIRRIRNAGDYLDDITSTTEDVLADLPLCRAIVDAAAKVLGHMPPY